MKRRGSFGQVDNDVLVVKPPQSGGDASLPPGHPDEKKKMHERAMSEVQKSARNRKVGIFRAIFEFLIPRNVSWKWLVLGGFVFAGLMYDAFQNQGTWRATLEEYVGVFGAIFGILVLRSRK